VTSAGAFSWAQNIVTAALTSFVNPVQTSFLHPANTKAKEEVLMVQLSIMAMVLGATVPLAVPAPRSRSALLATKGFGAGVFAAGLAGLGYALALA